MKVFIDPEVDGRDDHWSSVRLADLYEVARRLRRSGMRRVRTAPELLSVSCTDPVSGARVLLEIEPWSTLDEGWYWYATINTRNSLGLGPLTHERRMLRTPWPRETVRALWREIAFERRSFRKAR